MKNTENATRLENGAYVPEIKPDINLDMEQFTDVLVAMNDSNEATNEDWAKANSAYLLITGENGPLIVNNNIVAERRALCTKGAEDIVSAPNEQSENIRDNATAKYTAKSRAFAEYNEALVKQDDTYRDARLQSEMQQDMYMQDNDLVQYLDNEDPNKRTLKGLQELAELADDFASSNSNEINDFATNYQYALEENDTTLLENMNAQIKQLDTDAKTFDPYDKQSVTVERNLTRIGVAIDDRNIAQDTQYQNPEDFNGPDF